MQITVSLIFILFSLESNFCTEVAETPKPQEFIIADPTQPVAETDLKNYLTAKHKRRWDWLKRAGTYWKERKTRKPRFNFCSRTRAEKLHLCRAVLDTKEFSNIKIDGSELVPTKCKTREFVFLEMQQLPKTEGTQKLDMFSCVTTENPQRWFFLSGTGDEENPILFLYYGNPVKDDKGNKNIEFIAEIRNIDMKKLKEAREKGEERKREMQHEMLRTGPIAEVDGAAHEGPLLSQGTL